MNAKSLKLKNSVLAALLVAGTAFAAASITSPLAPSPVRPLPHASAMTSPLAPSPVRPLPHLVAMGSPLAPSPVRPLPHAA